jgi:hypothetical protein
MGFCRHQSTIIAKQGKDSNDSREITSLLLRSCCHWVGFETWWCKAVPMIAIVFCCYSSLSHKSWKLTKIVC